MGMFSKTTEEKAAVKKLRQADAALHANSRKEKAAGIRDITPEYEALNAAANEAASHVSWWRGGTKRR